MARIAALVVAAALAATPAAASAAQSNPFLPQQPTPEERPSVPAPQPAPAPVQQPGQEDVSGTTIVVIGLGVLVLMGGIWYGITHDARRATAGRARSRTSASDELAVRQGRSATRAAPRGRKLSAAERKRRKRGRAR